MAELRHIYRAGPIDCIIIHRHQDKSGNEGGDYRVVLLRRDQDQTGTWNSSQRFRPDDLPLMIYLLGRAHRFLLDLELLALPERPVDPGFDDIDTPEANCSTTRYSH